MFEFFQSISDFFNEDIYQFCVDAFAWFVTWSTIALVQFKIWAVSFSWDVAKSILETFDISGKISSSMSSVPGDVQNLLFFFRVPEVITNLFAGLVGRYSMRFIPGM